MGSNFKTQAMTAFDELELNHKKEFDLIYKKLSYQMLHSEAQILLRVLKKLPCEYDFDKGWYRNFIGWLGKEYKYKY